MQTTTGNYVAWGYASKNCWIDEEGHGLRRLCPLWESQKMVLEQLARLEMARVTSGSPDGLLLNILKARQLGVSTLSEALVAHRLVTRKHIRALSGADVEEQAGYLFRMVVRLYDQLPWFLKPGKVYFTKNRELSLDNQCFLKTAWGKSTRGALQSVSGVEGNKGSIGRGQTYSVVHISELPTWENPEDTAAAAIPTAHGAPSHRQYAGDWWHQHFASGKARRFANVFIPWSAEPSNTPCPPRSTGPFSFHLAHAAKCRRRRSGMAARRSPLRRPALLVRDHPPLLRDQGTALKFLKEYPADDHECFQYLRALGLHPRAAQAIDRAGRCARSRTSGSSSPRWTSPGAPARGAGPLRRRGPHPGTPDHQPKRPVPPLSPHGAVEARSPTRPTRCRPATAFRRLDKGAARPAPQPAPERPLDLGIPAAARDPPLRDGDRCL